MKNILNKLKENNSTIKKQEILKKYKDNNLLKNILYYALNPHYKFNVKKYNKNDNHSCECHLEDVFIILDKLRKREVTGHNAIHLVENMYMCLCEEDAYVFERILDKDLKCGVNTKLVNKVFDKLIPETPYLGAISFNKKKIKNLLNKNNELFAQLKLDGMFANLIISKEGIKLLSRSGKELYIEGFIKNDIKEQEDINKEFVITGELLIEGYDRYSANGLLNSLKTIYTKQNENKLTNKDIDKFIKENNITPDELLKKVYMVAWDMIPLEKWYRSLDETPYIERFNNLKQFLNISNKIQLVENRIVKSYKDMIDYFKEVKDKDLEGIIIKDKNVIFEHKKPNEIIKFKIEIELDLVITDLLYGNKNTKYENKINRIVCETSDSKIKTIAGGIDEKTMNYLTNLYEKNKNTNINNIINKIVTIKCSGLSYVIKDNRKIVESVLHPRFIELREDKDKANTLEECIEIEKMSYQLEEELK